MRHGSCTHLVLLALTWLMPGIAANAGMEPIDEQHAQLVLRMQGFENADGVFKRARIHGLVYEVGTWSVSDRSTIRSASLKYVHPRQKASSVLAEDSKLPMVEKIRRIVPEGKRYALEFGPAGRASNHISGLEYQSFVVGSNLQCVFMRQLFGDEARVDVTSENVNGSLGDRLIQGWYCEGPLDAPLSERSRTQFFEAVDAKDWSMSR